MMIMLAIVPVRLRAIATIRSPLGSHWALMLVELKRPLILRRPTLSPVLLPFRLVLSLTSTHARRLSLGICMVTLGIACQEAQPRHLQGDTRHCMWDLSPVGKPWERVRHSSRNHMNLEQAPASASKHAGDRDRAGLKPFDLSHVGKLLESGCHRVSNNSGLEHDPEAGSEPDASFDL